jgi:voltage-gated potassium channel
LPTNQHYSVWTVLRLLAFWIAILIPPFIERTFLGSRTYYFLYIGLASVFAMYGISLRTLFHFLQQTRREAILVWIGYLLWCLFLCCVLAVFAFQYDLLPHVPAPSTTQRRPLIDYLYYEIITFTTVGYGDIIPSTVQAKILAMFTALFGATHGVTFVAIILQALTRPPSKGEE